MRYLPLILLIMISSGLNGQIRVRPVSTLDCDFELTGSDYRVDEFIPFGRELIGIVFMSDKSGIYSIAVLGIDTCGKIICYSAADTQSNRPPLVLAVFGGDVNVFRQFIQYKDTAYTGVGWKDFKGLNAFVDLKEPGKPQTIRRNNNQIYEFRFERDLGVYIKSRHLYHISNKGKVIHQYPNTLDSLHWMECSNEIVAYLDKKYPRASGSSRSYDIVTRESELMHDNCSRAYGYVDVDPKAEEIIPFGRLILDTRGNIFKDVSQEYADTVDFVRLKQKIPAFGSHEFVVISQKYAIIKYEKYIYVLDSSGHVYPRVRYAEGFPVFYDDVFCVVRYRKKDHSPFAFDEQTLITLRKASVRYAFKMKDKMYFNPKRGPVYLSDCGE